MYYHSLYYVFFIVLVTHQTLSLNCGGGSITHSRVFGGNADDTIVSASLDKTGVLKLAGQSYNGAWTGYSIGTYQPDYWVAVFDINSGSNQTSLLDAGSDTINNADLSSNNLCLVGGSDTVDFVAVWENVSVALSAAPSWSYRGPGPYFDEARAVACTSDTVFIASSIDFNDNQLVDIVLKQFTLNGSLSRNITFSGSDKDVANDMLIQGDTLVIVGQTLSGDFPLVNAAQATKSAGRDAFVLSINATTGSPIFSTFFGGNGEDYAYAVAIDSAGYIYACGSTSSNDLTLPGAYSTTLGGISEAWLAVWSPTGALMFGSLFGSDGTDIAFRLDLLNVYDGGHLVFLAGSTDGTNFPLVENFATTTGSSDAFVLAWRLTPAYTSGSLSFSTRYGGSADDIAKGLSVLDNGVVLIGGETQSTDFPALNGTYNAGRDSFFTVFNCPALVPVAPSPSPSASPSTQPATVTCETADGCYTASTVAVQFEGDAQSGGLIPAQTIYPVDQNTGTVNTGTSLAVNYNRMEERDPEGNVVAQTVFPSTDYQLAVSTQEIGGTPVTVVTFTNTLASGTNITILNYLFEQDTTFNFADTSFPVSGGSTKSNILIEGWPFQSTQNTFHMVLNLDINPQPQPAVSTVDGDITTYSFETAVSTCQVSMLALAVADSVTTPVTSSVTATQINANFPYFENSLLYDPGYTVLVQNENEDEPSKKEKDPISQWAYIGAGIGVAVIALLIGGFVLTFMTKKKRRMRARTQAAIQHASEVMSRESRMSSVEVSSV
mmetsp:Transcript_694/g.950  ORF Transcript_694/g.950 Transcript_694/m.950 type:complete len:776 (+) Transcript_694:76-2403(+)